MVSLAYMLARPGGPSPAKRLLDQRLIPALIDAVGTLETLAARTVQALRRPPAAVLSVALAGGAIAFLIVRHGDVGPGR